MGNERLRTAMAKAHVDVGAVSSKTGVDPKTVQRWLGGRIPHARHRWAVAELLSEEETYLWPETTNARRATEASKAELVELYPFRSAVPASLWWDLFSRAQQQIGVLAYAANFLHEQYPALNDLLREKAAAGCKVRIALGDADSEAVRARGAEERFSHGIETRCRVALMHYQPLIGVPGVEVHLHRTTLYNSVYRADDDLLVNAHVWGMNAYSAPVTHLRRLVAGSLFDTYAASFEAVWAASEPAPALAEAWTKMTRIDYLNDPDAPAPTSIVPAASAVVTNDAGEILLQRRSDNDLWALPGGTMDFGERIAETVVREVREETGLEVEVTGIVGVYSDPGHVIAYSDGEVRQEFNLCFAAKLIGGQLSVSDESTEVRLVAPAAIEALPMHESIRLRIKHFLEGRSTPAIA